MANIKRISIGEDIYFVKTTTSKMTTTSFELLKHYTNGEPCFVGVHTSEYCLNILFNYVSNLEVIK